MMMSLSPPGLPSELSLRMEFASCESFAIPRVAAPAIKPRADRAEPNRMAKVLRVEVKFISMLLSIDNLEFVVRGKAKIQHINPGCDGDVPFSREGASHARRAFREPRLPRLIPPSSQAVPPSCRSRLPLSIVADARPTGTQVRPRSSALPLG